jgi:threonine/homoserine/homoserine lactone efflux protein
MIDVNLFFALISFYFVMYVTPGPNNAMVLTSGIKFGFLKTIPHMSGITIGHVLQTIIVCLGLGKIFQIFPEIQNILKIICALYLLYLGYKIIGSFSKIKNDGSRPLKFYEASLFQLVNPKAWTISTMVASGFLPKDERLIISILFISITALIICPLSISVWAAFGSGIRNLVKNNKKKPL